MNQLRDHLTKIERGKLGWNGRFFYGNHKLRSLTQFLSKRRKRKWFKTTRKGTKQIYAAKSNLELGTLFHEAACKDRKSCTTNKKLDQLLKQRCQFLSDYGLTSYCHEMTVCHMDFNLATQVDEMAIHKPSKELWHISWKTGYNGGENLLPSIRKAHFLQLLAERRMMIEQHNIFPKTSVVVYVTTKGYKEEFLQEYHNMKTIQDQKQAWVQFLQKNKLL